MNHINTKIKKIINNCSFKSVAILLTILLVTSSLPMGIFNLSAKAEANSVDGSTGGRVTLWSDYNATVTAGDIRYNGANYSAGTLGTSSDTPYIIKNADELAGLASLVNAGNSFENMYINVTGLTEAEAIGDLKPSTIDLCRYNGTTGGGGDRVYWESIGTDTTPFNGNFYSTTNADIINLILNETAITESANDKTRFGLFNYIGAGAVIGGDTTGFTLTFAKNTDGTPSMEVPTDITTLRTIGGLTTSNTGTISNIRIYGNINLPSNTVEPFTVGAVAAFNTGTVTGCYYEGTITSANERATSTETAAVGIGGICGYSSGNVSYCISNASIYMNTTSTLGLYIKVGGVVGYFSGSGMSISNCVFSGSLFGQNCNASPQFSYFGGIVGYMYSGSITKCIASADIDCYYTNSGNGNNIGGIAGVTKGAVSYCFAVGSLRGGNCVGGIAGRSSGAVSYSYYTGTIQNYASNTGNSAPSCNIGGLIGERECAVSNSYFAGSTLTSNVGSLFGYTRSNLKLTNVYYDKQVSPNSFSKSKKNGGNDTETNYSKTTAQLMSGTFTDSNWSQSANFYPQLSWAYNVDTATAYGKLVKTFSMLSAEAVVVLDATNSYSDADGNRNSYQMKADKTGNDVLNDYETTVEDVTITRGNWEEYKSFDGLYQSNKLGSVWQKKISIDTHGITIDNILIKRKLLSAVTLTEGSATTVTDSSFYRFLDHCNIASAGYIGGSFSLGENITTQVNVIKAFGTALADNKRFENVYSASLDGNGYKITTVSFTNNAVSLFGSSEEGIVKNVSFGTVNIGTGDTPITTTADKLSLLYSTAINSTASDIVFDTVNVNVSEMPSGFNYGLIVANDTKNTAMTNITVVDYNLKIGDFTNSANKTKNTPSDCGGLAGYFYSEVGGTGKMDNCVIQNMDASFDIYETSRSRGCGGLAGYVDNDSLTNCKVTGNVYGTYGIVSSSDTVRYILGGIAGVSGGAAKYTNTVFEGTVNGGGCVGGMIGMTSQAAATTNVTLTNCYAIGDVKATPKNPSLKNYVGGLIGHNDKATTINTSFFMGNVQGGNAGGIAGYVNGGALTINNSYSKAIVTGTVTSGGLVGASAQSYVTVTIKNSYFSGQVKGDGDKSGLISSIPTGKQAITNSYFDKSIAGDAIPTIASITTADPEQGKAIDNSCAVVTGSITAAILNSSSFIDSNVATNYPQIKNIYNVEGYKTHSDISTRKLFILDAESYLTSVPSFTLNQDSARYTVDRNTQTTDVLSPWDVVLYGPQDGSVYGKYTQKEKGNTTFTIKFSDYNNALDTLNMVYDINVRPFDYGSGTATDPYIIYNISELKKYRKYLNNKFDTVNQYYKIGSVVDGKIVGEPIQLDLSQDAETATEWEPIMNLSGHLDGNNSIITSINCSNGYTLLDDNDKVIDNYFGFFGTTNLTGEVKDLQLDNVNISPNKTGKIGTFIGQSAGGTYTNIIVTNASITNRDGNGNEMGGLVGSATLSGDNQIVIDSCMAYTTINKLVGLNSYGGGIVGRATVSGTNNGKDNLVIKNTAAYGVIKDVKYVGGLVGQIDCHTLIENSISTMDILTVTGQGAIGGLIGASASASPNYTITNSAYGGRIQATLTTNAIGGLVGSTAAKTNINSSANPFETAQDIYFIGENSNYKSEADVIAFVEDTLNSKVTNSYYNSDTNPYPTSIVTVAGTAYYITSSGSVYYTTRNYEGNLSPNMGRSYTCNMTTSSIFTNPDSWTYSNSHYPIPSFISNLSTADTKWDIDYIKGLASFNSLALYYTNAGEFSDNTFSNMYFMDDTASWKSTPNSTVKTTNGKMLQSTKEGSSTVATVEQTVNGNTFTKEITFVPSITACGVDDFSFIYANPNGMWVTEKAQADATIKYPFTIYTADQLQGMATLYNNANLSTLYTDGNGLQLDYSTVNINTPTGAVLGEQFIMANNIDCGIYNGNRFIDINNPESTGDINQNKIIANIRENYLPIGNTQSFNSTFSGGGYVLQNIYINSNCSDNLGVFGTVAGGQIHSLGVVSGTITANQSTADTSYLYTVKNVGGIAAKLNGSALVDSCFVAIPITGNADNTVYGGLCGTTGGSSNSIMNSFFTGYIFATGGETHSGGILGSCASVAIKNCYVAGYVASSYVDVVCPSQNGVTIGSTYFDLSAVGSIDNIHFAVNSVPTAGNLGSKWSNQDGLYPVQTDFISTSVTSNIAQSAIVPIHLTNARSVTKGDVTYGGAKLYYIPTDGFIGTVADNSGNVIGAETAFTEFAKAESGVAVLQVQSSGSSRDFIVNLQCWYDAGLSNNNVFIINTANELAEFALMVNGTLNPQNNPNGLHTHDGLPINFENCTVKLGANIDLSLLSEDVFNPIGTQITPFKGIFDGNGFVISNIALNKTDNGLNGLFGCVENATVKNVGLNGGTITGGGTTGSLVAVANNSQINGCFSSTTIIGGINAGGLIGTLNGGSVQNSFNFGELNGSGLVGGIVAVCDGTVSNCFNTGIIDAPTATVAAICPNNTGTISQCIGASFTNGATNYAIANGGNITDCIYDGQLTGAVITTDGVKKDTVADSYQSVVTDTMFEEVKNLAILRMRVDGTSYSEFTKLVVGSQLENGTDVLLTQNPADVFAMELINGKWNITSIDTGACYLGASSAINGIDYVHRYYVVAVMTMKIRYEFDFSELLDANDKNIDRVTGYVSTNTFNSLENTVKISTTQDYLDFVSYVNGGGVTTGKTFILGASIDLSAQPTVEPIGINYPFDGTFDGRGYTINGLSVVRQDRASMFDTIGQNGKVYNYLLTNVYVNAIKGSSDMYMSVIAGINKGLISNIGINGKMYTNNSNFSYDSYIGTLCANNQGRIKGCYFIQAGDTLYGIDHVSKPEDFVGGMVGYNTGTITGCYIATDLRVNTVTNIKTLVGNNQNRTDNIINCYYNMKGDNVPVYLPYAYDNVAFTDTFVTETMMKTKEFASWLSSNLYGGTFKQGSAQEIVSNAPSTVLNNGFPYLYMPVLSQYSLYNKLGDTNVLLSVKNLAESSVDNTFLNGIIMYQDNSYKYFDYKYFTSIVTHDKINFDIMLLPANYRYTISARVYGKNALYNSDVSTDTKALLENSTNAMDIQNTKAGTFDLLTSAYARVHKPNLVVAKIKITEIENYKEPWGVFRNP